MKSTPFRVFTETLDRAGVVYNVGTNSEGKSITVRATQGGSNCGVAGLYTVFQFGPKGELLHIGVWEEAAARAS